MARDLPGFVAKRVNQLRAKPALISIVDTTDTVDQANARRTYPSLPHPINRGSALIRGTQLIELTSNRPPGHGTQVFPNPPYDLGLQTVSML
ncbi:unnamed protein product, partial [Dibothriocephalus latus]